MMSKTLETLRVWTGLGNASGSRLTPDHGWLLPLPAEALRQRVERDAARAARPPQARVRA
jgi:hypothetical protein